MYVIRYHIHLKEPALVTALDGDPNSAVTFDYLPGSVLRGMVIQAYKQRHGQLPNDFSIDPDLQRLFMRSQTRYLNGYLVAQDTHSNPIRTLPTPLSWQRSKQKTGPIVDYATSNHSDPTYRTLDKPFCIQKGTDVKLYAPQKELNVHINREDRLSGRPTLQLGTVYRYEALRAEQTFEAFILCEIQQDAQVLSALLSQKAKIGGAKSVNYGLVELYYIERLSLPCEVGGSLQVSNAPIIMTFLSAALLRNEYGQYTVDKETLERYLGSPIKQAFLRSTLIGGFNAYWGLPLPQSLAVQMGSVLVLSPNSLPLQRLQELEETGIGERRNEGFGRVAFQWQTQPDYKVVEDQEHQVTPSEIITLIPDSQALATQMARRLLNQTVEQEIIFFSNKINIEQAPPSSQLFQLRQQIAKALRTSPPKLTDLEKHIDSIQERQVARKGFTKARVDGQNLLEWLSLKEPRHLSKTAEFLARLSELSQTMAGQVVRLSENDQLEARLQFIDTVLARAAKNERKQR